LVFPYIDRKFVSDQLGSRAFRFPIAGRLIEPLGVGEAERLLQEVCRTVWRLTVRKAIRLMEIRPVEPRDVVGVRAVIPLAPRPNFPCSPFRRSGTVSGPDAIDETAGRPSDFDLSNDILPVQVVPRDIDVIEKSFAVESISAA